MIPRNNILASVLLITLAGWGQSSLAQERISGGMNKKPGFEGGWVLEVGEEEPTQGEINVELDGAVPVQQQTAAPAQTAGPGVEMIVGGQGSDGVAKKGTLPVVD